MAISLLGSEKFIFSSAAVSPHTGNANIPAGTTTVVMMAFSNKNVTATCGGEINSVSMTVMQQLVIQGKVGGVFKLDNPTTGASVPFEFSYAPSPPATSIVYLIYFDGTDTTDSTYAETYGAWAFSSSTGRGGAATVSTFSESLVTNDYLVGFGLGAGVTASALGDDTLAQSDNTVTDFDTCVITQDIDGILDNVLTFQVNAWQSIATYCFAVREASAGATYVSSEYTTSSETRNFSSASYSASSNIRNYVSESYTGTSSVRNYVSASITFNSESYGFATGSYSVASSIANYVSASYTASSSIINYVSATYSSSAEIRNYATSSISFATSIANYVAGSFSGANEIRNYVTGAYSGNSEIEGFGFAGGSYTATSSIFNFVTASYSSSNSINNYASALYNAISSVFNYVSNTYTSAASIRSFVTAFYSSASSVNGLDIEPLLENKLDRNNYTKIANMILSGDVPYSEGADMYIRIGRRGLLNGTE